MIHSKLASKKNLLRRSETKPVLYEPLTDERIQYLRKATERLKGEMTMNNYASLKKIKL